MKFDIREWRSKTPGYRVGKDGTVKGSVETYRGVVDYFSFPGDGQHRGFTNLQMKLAWTTFSATLDRYYHPQWATRLCIKFAEECFQRSEGTV